MTPAADPRSHLVTVAPRHGHLVATIAASTIGQKEATAISVEVTQALASFEGKGRCFVLDLTQVGALSSLGLGMCVDLRHRAIERGMKPIVNGLNEHLLELFRVMKVDRLFTLVHGESDLERLLRP